MPTSFVPRSGTGPLQTPFPANLSSGDNRLQPVVAHLSEILPLRAKRFPRAIALGADEGLRWRTVDSSQLLALVDGVADELQRKGVHEGDRVVLWSPSGIRTPVFLFALWQLGAIVVPFDKDMNPQAAAAIIDSVEPRLVIFGFDQRPAWAPPDAIQWWEPRPTSPTNSARGRPAEDLAAIFFTSGTTGQPKG